MKSLDSKIIIGQIVEINPHPNADRLKVVQVRINNDRTVSIICGASNIKTNDVVPVVLPGGKVRAPTGSTFEVAEAEIRGEKSFGMMCSPLELGFSDDHETIFILPKKLAKFIGQPLANFLSQVKPPKQNHLSDKERFDLITRNTEEIITKDELKKLISSKTRLRHYIGFEISGQIHLGTGLISMGKVADFIAAGVDCTIFLADFHSYLNKKLGGDWQTIRRATNDYFKQGLIASLKCFGVKEDQVKFVMGKDLYENNLIHWETFMEVGQHVTLARNLRSISIMGKKQGESVDMATLFYPPLQVADIFTLQANIAHAGMDQRKAHVIARQVAPKLKINPLKNSRGDIISPIAIHHNLIAGLDAPKKEKQSKEDQVIDLKMSKSKPGSAIFVHDTPDQIKDKINRAYCPPKEAALNPIINWVQFLIFWGQEQGKLEIRRPKKFGGDKTYTKFSDLIADYKQEQLHPQDLKQAVADWLIAKLAPAREHFSKGIAKKGLEFMKKLNETN